MLLGHTLEFGYEQLNEAYLPLVGRGKPSKAQVTCGVGLPAAEHFKDTAGPGCNVCSMKEYSSIGGASTKSKNKATDVHVYFSMVWFIFNHHYHSRLPLRYTLCAPCVFIRLQRSIWSTRGYETGQRNIERNTSGSGISFFFFFNVTARHRLDSHSREIFLFSLHWWGKKKL